MSAQFAKDQPKSFTNRIERVAIVGAGGRMGKPIAEELLKTGNHTVTALTRPGSSTSLPSGVKTAEINYDDEASIVTALEGQDFLVITLSVTAPKGTHSKLVQAAAKAGVKYIMPNVYGSDPAHESLGNEIMTGPEHRQNVAEIQSLGMTSVVLSCGFWYEWSLGCGPNCLGFDLDNKTLVLFDEGEVKASSSTWPQCGRAAAAVLSLKVLPDDADDKSPTLSQFFNGIVYISSFLLSQKDIFESVKRVTGTSDSDWTVTSESSEKRWREGREAMMKGDRSGFVRMLYSRLFFPNGGGDHETTKGVQNGLLGLPTEDLDEWTKETIRMVKNKELPAL